MDHFIHTTSEDSDSNDCEDEYDSDYSDEQEVQEPLIWMTSSNGNEKPFYNLYSFHLDYCKSGKNYWKCDKCKMGCKARIHTVAGSNEFLKFNAHSPLQSHNHEVKSRELFLARARSRFRQVEGKAIEVKTNQIDKAKRMGEKRSAKVSFCLGKLKRLLTYECVVKSAKLEKADILEMTMTHVKKQRQKNEQLLQQIQQLSRTNNGQLTHLNTVPKVMSPVTNDIFDALSLMGASWNSADTLSTAECPKALPKDMRGSFNTHMNFQVNPIPNGSIAALTSLAFSRSESEAQQRFFPAGLPADCLPYFPKPFTSDLPQQAVLNLQYDHHMSLMQQFHPAANFQSSSLLDSVSRQLPIMQLPPGLMPAANTFISSTDPSASVPMTTPSWETNVAIENAYLLQCNQSGRPAAYNFDSHSYDPLCRTGTTVAEFQKNVHFLAKKWQKWHFLSNKGNFFLFPRPRGV